MAVGPITSVTDLVVPEIFTGYTQQETERKSRLVQSGALARSPLLDQHLAGGGNTFKMPNFKDLDDDADNVSTDDVSDVVQQATYADVGAYVTADPTFNDSVPLKTGTATEIAVRLSRNQSWSSSDLAGDLAGADPLGSIQSRVANYWTHRLQAAFIATVKGVFLDNTAGDAADYTNDISGGGFVDGVTNFSTEAFIDTKLTMGDSSDRLTIMMVHSVVMARMQKNNLIDFIPDARGEVNIPMFQGHEVIVDDSMPVTAGVYDTWVFGSGAVMFGVGNAKVPTETERKPAAGNGGGQEILFNRVEWVLHPVGHAYTGTSPDGGPSNAASTDNLEDAASWDRIYTERKQVKIARLVSRES